MKHGFITVASAVPVGRVADCEYNAEQISNIISQAEDKGVEILVFPELCITGYTCQDLFFQSMLIEAAEASIVKLLEVTSNFDVISIVGSPVVAGDLLLNCAVVIQHGVILGVIPKTYLPNYGEFYEKRWFASSLDLNPTEIDFAGNKVLVSSVPQLFRTSDGAVFGVEICEDVWAPTPPSNRLCLEGADIIFNLSASDELIGKHDYLKSLLAQQSARTITGYVYSGCGFGESTQDVVYGGNMLVFENGMLLKEGERFSFEPQLTVAQIDIERLRSERRTNSTYVNAQRSELRNTVALSQYSARITDCKAVRQHPFEIMRDVNPFPFVPEMRDMDKSCEDVFNIQVAGLAKRLLHTSCNKVVLGISGGADSTLALLVCVKTFDKLGLSRKGIIGVTMPGFGTTDRTYNNAVSLMKSLDVTVEEINISAAVMQHFSDIGHDSSVHDVTYENSQARERTQILMDLSNKLGAIVVGTGDLSELALGWATYNGDHMSMYGVNVGIPKTLIKHLINFVAKHEVDDKSCATLMDIIDTPISPELIPAEKNGDIKQKTEDIVGPYELHDFFLYYMLRFGFRPSKIFILAKKAFNGKYDDDVIKKWLTVFVHRFFSQQFKRSCLPDGTKVGSVSLSPRGDWRMPSDASSAIWLSECEAL